MACLKVSGLQEYLEFLEEAEPSPLRRIVESRLASCAPCRARFDRVVATHRRVNTWLGRLSSSATSTEVDSAAALAHVLGRIEAAGLFATGMEIPWYKSIGANVRDLIRPEKLPPLKLTSQPVAVRDMWGRGTNPKALAGSVIFQGAIVALLMLIGTNDAVRAKITQMTLIAPPVVKPAQLKTSHGGGGGQRSPLPPLKGELPKPAPRVFTVPLATVAHPALVMDPSLLAPSDAWAVPTSAIGNPLGVFGGGAGPGNSGGIGPGDGVGIGVGTGATTGGDGEAGIYSAGKGITAPSVLSKVDPEYSEEARKAKYSGAVVLSIVVNTDGRADNIRVVKSLGMGLDEKAIEAVERWRFKPGTNKGVSVRVRAQIEVNFRLL